MYHQSLQADFFINEMNPIWEMRGCSIWQFMAKQQQQAERLKLHCDQGNVYCDQGEYLAMTRAAK